MKNNYVMNNPDAILDLVQDENTPLVSPWVGEEMSDAFQAALTIPSAVRYGKTRWLTHCLQHDLDRGCTRDQIFMKANLVSRLACAELSLGSSNQIGGSVLVTADWLLKQPKPVRDHFLHRLASQDQRLLANWLVYRGGRAPRVKSVDQLRAVLQGCRALKNININWGVPRLSLKTLIRIGRLSRDHRKMVADIVRRWCWGEFRDGRIEAYFWAVVQKFETYAQYRAAREYRPLQQSSSWTDGVNSDSGSSLSWDIQALEQIWTQARDTGFTGCRSGSLDAIVHWGSVSDALWAHVGYYGIEA